MYTNAPAPKVFHELPAVASRERGRHPPKYCVVKVVAIISFYFDEEINKK